MANIPKPALTRSLDFLQNKITSQSWIKGQRLPCISHIAIEAQVSTNVMREAIGILKNKGIFAVSRKRGVYLGKPSKEKILSSSENTPSSVNTLVTKISTNLISGKLGIDRNHLSTKEIIGDYGYSYRTVKQALSILVSQKKLERAGRGYGIVRTTYRSANHTIVFIQGSDFNYNLTLSYFRSRFYSFLASLEKQCAVRNLRLFNLQHNNGRLNVDENFSAAVGFVLWIDVSIKRYFKEIVLILKTFDKPIVIFDESIYPLSADDLALCAGSRKIFFFSIPDKAAGEAVGSYLIEAGHRKVGFFSYGDPPTPCFKLRYDGLNNAFSLAGIGKNPIVPFFMPHSESEINTQLLTEDDCLIKDQLSRNGELIMKKTTELLESISDPAIKSEFANLFPEQQFHHVRGRYLFTAKFREALADPDITAWVAAEDYIAIFSMLTFLNRNRIKTPKDIAIIGFNNMVEAYSHSITSYDFNIPGIVAKFVDIIVNCPPKKSDLFNDVSGYIVQRGSTGPQ